MSKSHKDLAKRFRVQPGKRLKLNQHDPDDTAGIFRKREYEAILKHDIQRLFEQETLLWASRKYAVLVVLQGPDAAGKDGTIRHVMTGLNPQACRVTAFKVPTDEESHHDFLWRVHKAVPMRGEIGVFNRSHYEDVLVARVHKLVPKDVWSARYGQINDFEKILAKNQVVVLKFFLHISKKEQEKRLEARITDQSKNWKLSPSDFAEHRYYDQYVEAYEDALTECSTERAPWYVIPSNHKWFRNLAVAQILTDTMTSLKMKYPPPSFDVSQLREAMHQPS
ncbi:MAG: polyphosphate kinase 2 family protein [Bryobacteraceae bacterium]|jgi:PPK2 family polyphosphate:nucleotide phosphotransferase